MSAGGETRIMVEFEFTVDPEPDAELSERGRRLFAQGTEFVLGVAGLEQLPQPDRLEVCFAGRSNVGKSSLLNAVTGRRSLARTSNTPGRTQQLNFFDVSGRLYLVDLPGYGFAKAPVDIVARWQAVLAAYLRGRPNLRRVFVLIDSRHGPRPADRETMALLDAAAVGFQVVMTKIDKPRGGEAARALASTLEALRSHPTAYPEVLVTSAETGAGVPSVHAAIAGLLED